MHQGTDQSTGVLSYGYADKNYTPKVYQFYELIFIICLLVMLCLMPLIVFMNFDIAFLMRLHFALLGRRIDGFDCLSLGHVLGRHDGMLAVPITLLRSDSVSFGLLIIVGLSRFFFILVRLPFIATDVKNHYRSFQL